VESRKKAERFEELGARMRRGLEPVEEALSTCREVGEGGCRRLSPVRPRYPVAMPSCRPRRSVPGQYSIWGFSFEF
jgi:hypothetical protein